MEQLATYIQNIRTPIAEISASLLEMVGIFIIVIGAIAALVRILRRTLREKRLRLDADFGKALSFALEFKMGAEIIKTVLIHNLEELAILGIVIILRALLAFLLHWERRIKTKEDK